MLDGLLAFDSMSVVTGTTMRLKSARRSLALPVAVLLATGICACGSGKSSTTDSRVSTSTAAAVMSSSETARLLRTDADKDNDFEAGYDDRNNSSVLTYGHPASPSVHRAIVSLLERYYKLALAREGAKACALLYATLAEGVAEDYGSFAGPVYMRGNNCPTVMTKLFIHYYPVLAIKLPKFKVRWMGLENTMAGPSSALGDCPNANWPRTRRGATPGRSTCCFTANCHRRRYTAPLSSGTSMFHAPCSRCTISCISRVAVNGANATPRLPRTSTRVIRKFAMSSMSSRWRNCTASHDPRAAVARSDGKPRRGCGVPPAFRP